MPEPVGLERYQRTEGGLPVIGLEAWARSVEGAEPVRAERGAAGVSLIRQEVELVTRAIDATAKTITIVAGTSGVDRYRDRIMVAGYDDAQFRRNPIMPWCHEYWSLPVAQGINPRIEGDGYVLEASFADTSRIYPFASMVWEMYAAKILRMASVGGMPTLWSMDEARRGMDVTAFDLWEVSLCPLGVNPDAMAKAKLNGIDATPMDAWAREVADAGGSLVLSKSRAEALIKALGYGQGLALFSMDAAALQRLRAIDADGGEDVIPPLAVEEMAFAGIAPPTGAYDPWDLIIEAASKAEKPKPRQKGEDEPEPEPEEKATEPDPVQECGGVEDDEYELDLEALAEGEDDEIELEEAELQAAVEAAVRAALAERQSIPAGEAR
jgi:hypothetical protein